MTQPEVGTSEGMTGTPKRIRWARTVAARMMGTSPAKRSNWCLYWLTTIRPS